MRKPYYLKKRDTWMVWHEGRQVRLGTGISEKQAYDEWKKLDRGLNVSPATPVAELLQEFFSWLQLNRSPATTAYYENFITSFGRAVKKPITKIAGYDSVSLATLCGHDPATLASVYQKLSQNPEYLRGLANKVRSQPKTP